MTESSQNLRKLAEDALRKQLYPTAAFYANKLVATNSNSIPDLLLLAEAYNLMGQHKRAVHVLKDFVNKSPECKYLAAKCRAKAGDWDGCLEMIGDGTSDATMPPATMPVTTPSTVSIDAAICLLRAEALDALDLRSRAAHWYKQAVKRDVTCYEAFAKLIDNCMLTHKEERELLQSLVFPSDMEWLESMYRSKVKIFVSNPAVDAAIEDLEKKHKLGTNSDVLVNKAESLFYSNQYKKAYDITKAALEKDPHNTNTLLIVHLSTLVELDLKHELFYLAHKLVEDHPKLAIAWYAVGCYYYSIKNYASSRRFLSKSTVIDRDFGPAWLAFGHAFAAEGENDQALAAYRTAARLMPGSHIPPTAIAMELIRANNFALALEFLEKARVIQPLDPLPVNEIGVVYLKDLQYAKAIEAFSKTLEMCGMSNLSARWEPTLFNMGHCYRKLGQHEKALKYYTMALNICPSNPSTYTAIGFTHHLCGHLGEAIEYYHQALGLAPDDTFAGELLQRALDEQLLDQDLDDFLPERQTETNNCI